MRTSEADPFTPCWRWKRRNYWNARGSWRQRRINLAWWTARRDRKAAQVARKFRAVWPTFDLDQRQRSFRLLINRIASRVFPLIGCACRLTGSMPYPRVWMSLISGSHAHPLWSIQISEEEKEFLRRTIPLATPGAIEALA